LVQINQGIWGYKKIFWIVLVILSIGQSVAQGQIKESLTLDSRFFGKKMEYSIYLPPGYESSNRSYPVLYLLHGYTDDETGWTQYGEIEQIMNEMTANGTATQMIRCYAGWWGELVHQ